MTNEELFAKLRPIVMLATGVPECILADQAGPGSMPAPKGAYATITPRQSVSERGQANIIARNIPGEQVEVDVRAQIMCSCSVNFYRGQALMYAERLKQANKRPDISMMLFKSGIGWNSTDAINNLTGLYQAAMEERAQLTLYLYGESVAEDRVQRIYRAGFSAQLEQSGATAQGEVNGLSG